MKLFGRKRSHQSDSVTGLDGVITFYGSHHALKGEKVLSEKGISVVLIPGPREISPNCGTAIRFDYKEIGAVEVVLSERKVLFEQIVFYPAQEEK